MASDHVLLIYDGIVRQNNKELNSRLSDANTTLLPVKLTMKPQPPEHKAIHLDYKSGI